MDSMARVAFPRNVRTLIPGADETRVKHRTYYTVAAAS